MLDFGIFTSPYLKLDLLYSKSNLPIGATLMNASRLKPLSHTKPLCSALQGIGSKFHTDIFDDIAPTFANPWLIIRNDNTEKNFIELDYLWELSK